MASSEGQQAAAIEAINRLEGYTSSTPNDNTRRILQAFIQHLPPDGKANIVSQISNCRNDIELVSLAKTLVENLLIPLKAAIILQSIPLELSPLDRDAGPERKPSELDEPDSSLQNDLLQLKQTCLVRDGYKCVVTGYFDHTYAMDEAPRHLSNAVPTQVAHIMPFVLGHVPEELKLERAKLWEALYTCFPRLGSILDPTKINHPSNALTLIPVIREQFGEFNLALESTERPNVYYIKTYPHFPQPYIRLFLPRNRLVTLRTDTDIPQPSKDLVETHAAIAQILSASGMGETIDDLLAKLDDMTTLARDGTSRIEDLLAVQLAKNMGQVVG
ncbi:hypothetical protein L228DRAFT_284497 [Xylona heveae TC161]|uniref:HNH nuclease domain-containing protein n=1 Tax=Xylona heveae (strain CBS 132557 / TC161) TaxID=1328760 RepID=A0A165AIE9_XYLHT|nr:hypothetical protein L228DRAFT_284497 [Xylona heveae TC161]KZF20531.1 hypothetical protein L228DRAFT_284497 [Xylona heveae TC161]